MNRTRVLPILLVVAILSTLLAPMAHAEPDTSQLERLQRELRTLESEVAEQRSELSTLDDRASRLSDEQVAAQTRLEEIEAELSEAVERYNEAVVALEAVQAALTDTTDELEQLTADIGALSASVGDHARRLHKLGPSLEFTAYMGASGPNEIGFRSISLRQIIAADQAGIEQLGAATARAGALEQRLAEQEAEAAVLAEDVERELIGVQAAHDRHADELAELEATLASVRTSARATQVQLDTDEAALSTLRDEVDAEQQRVEQEREEAERRRQQEAEAQQQRDQAAEAGGSTSTGSSPSTGGSSSGGTSSGGASGGTSSGSGTTTAPAPSTRRSADVAVATALGQVGKPYRWGANGPGSFDCSGLTSFAWRAAGVTIPRTSRAQYSGLRRVSRAQLQPGDLVFYNSPISHVAMYVGGDTIVEASRTGIPVRTASLSRRMPVGYARP